MYITGDSYGVAGTLAYDATTGGILWKAQRDGPPFGGATGRALAVAPDGASVFVTGTIGLDYGTIAYDAATGKGRWEARYEGPGGRDDDPHDIGVTPDGKRVYVTGGSIGLGGLYDYATVAYAAVDGRQLAVDRYNGPRNRSDEALALAVNAVNGDVYVTGYSDISAAAMYDFLTIAYQGR